MSTKTVQDAELKVLDTSGQHVIEFYALAFSAVPDKNGDRIAPAAVDAWLEGFYAASKPLPISFTHAAVEDMTDPEAYVGYAPADPEHVWKDDHGLRVRGALYDTPKAEQVYRITRDRLVTSASMAYFVDAERVLKDGSRLITKLSLLEAGPCLDPANEEAYIVAVKSMEGKAVDESAWDGNRAMDESKIRDAIRVLQDVLSSLGEEGPPAGKSDEERMAKLDPTVRKVLEAVAAHGA